MHCDLVVALDAPTGLVLAIGGNVENAVSLVPYRLTLIAGVSRIRSVCRGEKLCSDERLFTVLALDAPQSEASLAQAPALHTPPAQPAPLTR